MVISKCPNCNAPLVWQDDRKVYLCEYCRAEFHDEAKQQEVSPEPEKKVIHEIRYVNAPESTAQARKKNPGCLRGVIGGICLLMGAAGFTTDRDRDLPIAIAMVIIGIWLLVMAGRRK